MVFYANDNPTNRGTKNIGGTNYILEPTSIDEEGKMDFSLRIQKRNNLKHNPFFIKFVVWDNDVIVNDIILDSKVFNIILE